MPLSIVGEALDLRDVSLFSFNSVGISTRCRRVVAMILSLSSAAPRTSLVILVLLIGLVLMGGLLTRNISKEKISGLSFSKVLLLFFSGFALLGTS